MDSNRFTLGPAIVPAIDDILRDGARRALQAAIEREVEEYIERNKQNVDDQGQPLWKIDDRELQADLLVKRVAAQSHDADVVAKQSLVAAAQAKYDRLAHMPRVEEIAPAEAQVQMDLHLLEDAKDRFAIYRTVTDARAISKDDLNARRHAVEVAQARVDESKANLALLKAGAWVQDLKVAQADIDTAKADVTVAQSETALAKSSVQSDIDLLERMTVTAPVDGQAMQVKIHLGEYAPVGEVTTPLIMLGSVKNLVVRTDVDENDAWRVPRNPAGKFRAIANLRGNRSIASELKFYRIEPYVIPKKSLTGDSIERIDTRVLQVLYTFDAKDKPIYVGQQMDVFIETAPVAATQP